MIAIELRTDIHLNKYIELFISTIKFRVRKLLIMLQQLKKGHHFLMLKKIYIYIKQHLKISMEPATS